MKKVRADINQAGTIIINASTPGGAWLAEYEFTNAEAMQKKASKVDWVERPNGKVIKGKNYSLRMAKNDWKNS